VRCAATIATRRGWLAVDIVDLSGEWVKGS
jgi:hypothetical protein